MIRKNILGDIENSQYELVNAIKELLFHTRRDLFDVLDFDKDEIFLEPLLFAYFNSKDPAISLDQILYGYIGEDIRPEEVTVASDEKGIIYLPNIGYLITRNFNSSLQLFSKKESGSFQLKSGSEEVSFHFEALKYIPGTAIEVVTHNNPLLRTLFLDEENNLEEVNVEATLQKHESELYKAVKILQDFYPDYYDQILLTTKKFLLYNSEGNRSFASIQAQGIAFFNVKNEHDEVAILEDITHQCGHVVFLTFFRNPEQFLKVDMNLPLKNFTKYEKETRRVEDAFHAFFPYCSSNICFDICLDKGIFSNDQLHELKGRFSFQMMKFKYDILNFFHKELFTDEGWVLYENFKEIFETVYNKRKGLLDQYDVSNQNYDFSYKTFQSVNSIN